MAPSHATAWPCLLPREGGSLLRVAVVPQARRDGADGLHDGALRVRLLAPPVDGKANAALQTWLCAELGIARRDVALLRGLNGRRKEVAIALPVPVVAGWLERLLGPQAAAGPAAAATRP